MDFLFEKIAQVEIGGSYDPETQTWSEEHTEAVASPVKHHQEQ